MSNHAPTTGRPVDKYNTDPNFLYRFLDGRCKELKYILTPTV
ncbi:hypothetical protein D1AOALGA4SA_3713 [Olavius algarvensis Delta 1 endosymbiont]|nr:hypothetical protein D1AOALGA4SA_3713 [Olavius algarvensis Delta 1 endosymbiont]